MEFNVDKCKIMHLGRLNPGNTYTMEGANLSVTTDEKDLGVLVENELNYEKHCQRYSNLCLIYLK